MKFEDRIIALQFEEIKELSEKIIDMRKYCHKISDELAEAHARNRILKDRLADYELLLENEDKVSAALADALETIHRLQSGEVQP